MSKRYTEEQKHRLVSGCAERGYPSWGATMSSMGLRRVSLCNPQHTAWAGNGAAQHAYAAAAFPAVTFANAHMRVRFSTAQALLPMCTSLQIPSFTCV